MFYFILFLNFLKTSDNQSDNLAAINSQVEVDEKHVTDSESSEYESCETNMGEDTEHAQQKNQKDIKKTCDSESTEKRTEKVLIEILGSETDEITNPQIKETPSHSEVNPQNKVEPDLDILEDENMCFIPLPQIEYQILDPIKDFSFEIKVINDFNECILNLSNAQEQRIKLLKLLIKFGRYWIIELKNPKVTVASEESFVHHQADIIDRKNENMVLYKHSLSKLNEQKVKYENLNLKYSKYNLKKLDCSIKKNDNIYEKLDKANDEIQSELFEISKEWRHYYID